MITDEPYHYFLGSPVGETRVPTIFRSDGVRSVIENPPTLRTPTLGWDLQTLNRAEIDQGKRLRIESGDRQTIDLYPDGRLIAIAILGDFLGWPRTPEQFAVRPELNSLAQVEYLFNCALTYRAVIDYCEPVPEEVRLQVGFRNLWLSEDVKVYLSEGIPGRIGFPRERGKPAPDPNWDSEPVQLTVDAPELFAARATYELARRTYNWFGYADDVIPFVDLENSSFVKERFNAEVRQ